MLDADRVLSAVAGLAARALDDPVRVGADLVFLGGPLELAGRETGHGGPQAAPGGLERDALGVQRVKRLAPPAAENAEQDVLGGDRGLSEALGLLARELDALPGLGADRDPLIDGRVALLDEVAVLAMGGLLADPQGPRDLAPGGAPLEGAKDDFGLGGVELPA